MGRHSGTSQWVRIFLPALIVLVWLTAAAIGGPYFGKVSEVSTNDQSSFLPESAESTEVQSRLPDFFSSETIPAVMIIVPDDGINIPEENGRLSVPAEVQNILTKIQALDGVTTQISPAIPAKDGRAFQVIVPLDSAEGFTETVQEIRTTIADGNVQGWQILVTGPAGFTGDLIQAFSGIDGLLLIVAILAVLLILVLVYRSALLPFIVLASSLFALTAALLTVWWLAKFEILVLTGQTQGILFILVIGAATDYALLFTARFKEELLVNPDKSTAIFAAWRGSFEPILASGGTVIAGLLCLLFSDLSSNKSLGPVAAIGIAFALLSALTLLPALLMLFGRAAFWPRKAAFVSADFREESHHSGVYARIGNFIQKRPRTIWLSSLAILLIGGAFVTTLKADGVAQSEFVLGHSEARDGQALLAKHFAAGSGSPLYVVASEQDVPAVVKQLQDADFIDSLQVVSKDSPSGSIPVNADGSMGFPVGSNPPDGQPTIVAGDVLFQATLTSAGDSLTAQDDVASLRQTFADLNLSKPVLIGGESAVALDTNVAALHDRNVIIPLVLVVIFLLLCLLLRSILAPILLIMTTVVSFVTALGVAALVFNHIFQFPGADPAVTLYGFVFLVALGIDYNIFLMTRVREEALHVGTRRGILAGLSVTGGVITSAGIVLAVTFAALGVIPILFLAQIAFIVSFGVLVDTFLVRTLLVPALTLDIGRAIWWPSKLSRQ